MPAALSTTASCTKGDERIKPANDATSSFPLSMGILSAFPTHQVIFRLGACVEQEEGKAGVLLSPPSHLLAFPSPPLPAHATPLSAGAAAVPGKEDDNDDDNEKDRGQQRAKKGCDK
jgi:hypothetical protein